ncbi:hypothetical protein TWF281_006152 [Arthrobotrys megalospora]
MESLTTNVQAQDNIPAAPTNASSDGSGHPGVFRRVTDKVLIPVIALGLATPVVSQGICFVGSKILKHKMERETEVMMARARASGCSNGTQGDSIALTREEEEMRKAEMNAIKEHFKRRKEEAKVQRQLLKAEKAAMRKNELISARRLKKKASPAATTNQQLTEGSNPPTYSEATNRFDASVPKWERTGPGASTLPPHPPGVPITYIHLSPGANPAPGKCKAFLNWIQDKKTAASQGCKFGEKKAAFKSKLKANKKVGLVLGFGYWGNY